MRRIEYVNQDFTAKVSIIIPCRTEESLVFKQLYPAEAEVIAVIGDEPPGVMRDYGVAASHGEFVAFIDSDAYPSKRWLYNVLIRFELTDANAVCGPGVLPDDSPFRERLTDMVLRWMPYNYRVLQKKPRWVAEFPTFNLIVRWKAFNDVGGFGTKSFGTDMISGEDTILCRKMGKIFYHPDILVYHKRRPFGIKFLKQIARFGRNRGALIALVYPVIPLAIALTSVVYAFNFLIGLYRRWICGR